LAAGAEPVKTASTSQQSYDKLIDHFAQLIATLTAEPKYIPNENELKVATLNTMLTDLRAKNTAVITATTALSNARIARDKTLYAETLGMVDTAQDVKQYVKSLFGATSPQYKQVSGLKFNRPKGD
jgi:propanediol dehydratase large subunit